MNGVWGILKEWKIVVLIKGYTKGTVLKVDH